MKQDFLSLFRIKCVILNQREEDVVTFMRFFLFIRFIFMSMKHDTFLSNYLSGFYFKEIKE